MIINKYFESRSLVQTSKATTDMSSQSNAIKIVDSVDPVTLAREHISATGTDESFYLLDCGSIVRRFQLWQKLFPRIVPFYATKSNSHTDILITLASLGAGFDCASMGEIEKVLSLGVNPDKIVFAHTVKTISHVKYAKSKNVNLIVFDNAEELHKMKKHYPEAKLLLRLSFNPKTLEKVQFSEKFGCPPDVLAENLLQLAKELELNVTGICFHIGIGCIDYNIYTTAIEEAARFFEIGKRLGFNMTTLDIGGGFSGKAEKEAENIEAASIINRALDKFFPDPSVRLLSEPGQFIAEQSCLLAVNVHSKKIAANVDGQLVHHYYVTDGIYQSFAMAYTHNWPAFPKPMSTPANSKTHLSTIWGRACDATDVIAKNIQFPEINIGDWITFENFGAYRAVVSCGFNGFVNHPVVGFISKKDWATFQNIKVLDL